MSQKFSDEQLLAMAMGITSKESNPDEAEFVEIAKLKSEWMIIPERKGDKWTKRKKMRHIMFKIIKRMKRDLELFPEMEAIKAIIDPQLDANKQHNWASFTFYWDLNPQDHTKIITKDKWFMEGGRYDDLGALQPTAFTEQEIS
jgi:vancomycin resistance protein YoaR